LCVTGKETVIALGTSNRDIARGELDEKERCPDCFVLHGLPSCLRDPSGGTSKRQTRVRPAFQDRLGLAQSSRHPFIFVPGDNEWADCHQARPRTYDPFERLAKLRQMFFQGDRSLGRRTMRLTRQSE
jgi:hypothetical protein